MQTKIIEGIIISKTPYAENDEMLNVLTENAFINIYAKGVKKISSKNRVNVFRGALVSFEIFNSYATAHSVLLKKAIIIQGLPEINKTNAQKIEILLKIIKNIKDYHHEIFDIYTLMIKDFDNVDFYKNQTFLVAKILDSLGEGLSFSSCVQCGTNQDLFGFDILQGGILCQTHGNISTPLALLKSLFLLGESREKYVLSTAPEINQQIFAILSNLLF